MKAFEPRFTTSYTQHAERIRRMVMEGLHDGTRWKPESHVRYAELEDADQVAGNDPVYDKPTVGPWQAWQLSPDSDAAQRHIVVADDAEIEVCGIIDNPHDVPILANSWSLLRAVRELNQVRNLDYLLACGDPTCKTCPAVKTWIAEIRRLIA